MRKLLFIVFALLISLTSICSASVITSHLEKWENINAKEENSTYYVDKTDIKYNKEYILLSLAAVAADGKSDDIYKIKYYIDDDMFIVTEMILYVDDKLHDSVKYPLPDIGKVKSGSTLDIACQYTMSLILKGYGTKI